MDKRTADTITFLARTMRPFLVLVLALSVGANIFLIRSWHTAKDTVMNTKQSAANDLLLGEQAFGEVDRGFVQVTQTADASGALLPAASSYVVTSGLLPAVPSSFVLYRDQGIASDDAWLARLMQSFGVPFDTAKQPLFASKYVFRTQDGLHEVTLSLDDRRLFIRRISDAAAQASAAPAPDEDIVAIATAFANGFSIDLSPFGPAHIAERPIAPGGPLKSFVIWNATFDGKPLIDVTGKPIEGLAVEVNRLSRTATNLSLSLVTPSVLARAPYPAATKATISAGLASGGVLPLALTQGKTKPLTVTYDSADIVYVLYKSDASHPTYVVPALRVSFELPAKCSSCVSPRITTFVPALDPAGFTWYVRPPAKAPVLSAGSGAAVPATTTVKKKK